MKRAQVGIYQFPENAKHWFAWRGSDGGLYAYLCSQCAEPYGDATLVLNDDSFSCDICQDFGYSDEDWQMDDDDGKVG